MKLESSELLKRVKSLSPQQIEQLKGALNNTDNNQTSAMAITGIAFNFPGKASTLESFWTLLQQGTDCIEKLAVSDRFNADQEQPHSKTYWGGFLKEDIDKFDASFFRISPKEAELMDPQHRLLLQTVWHALEDAAYVPSELSDSRTGVFVGGGASDYAELLSNQSLNSAYAAIGNAPSLLANRISYFFNWHGPSETIDTACSSSLVALHQAVGSLRRGECDQAIVGGVNLLLSSRLFEAFTEAGMLGTNGRCKTLDAQAEGYVRGEGVVAIVLKPLSKALSNKNQIYGVIRGTAVNHGGKSNSLTAPNLKAQAQLIKDVYSKSKIPIETVGYIEMHGTGTPLGDPIEVEALQEAFNHLKLKDPTQKTCGLGSVKSNIGHLEAAAGLSGLIKVLACLRYKQLPPTLHFQSLNPHIQLENSPFHVVSRLQEWAAPSLEPNSALPRRAGVSSFGFGGSNAHVVIEEGPEHALSTRQSKPSYLLTLSAKHPDSLKQRIEDLHAYLKAHPDSPLEAVAYTLNNGRSHFEYRCVFVVSSLVELQEKLAQVHHNQKTDGHFQGNKIKEADEATQNNELKSTLEELNVLKEGDTQLYRSALETLASFYIQGYDLDWMALHKGESQQSISLPTYPFLKERYWFSQKGKGRGREAGTANDLKTPALHPLLDANTSTFEAQCFTKTFTGQEFYLTDHRINGVPTLPGVAYIEMAYAAAERASPQQSIIGLSDVVWLRPISISNKSQLTKIRLYLERTAIKFTVETESWDGDSANPTIVTPIIHAQGAIKYVPRDQNSLEPIYVNMEAIQAGCDEIKSKETLYTEFTAQGLQYGPGFQAVKKLWKNKNEVLAKLFLPKHLAKESHQWKLHPSLLDGALQAAISVLDDHSTSLRLPFSLEELDIFHSFADDSQEYYVYGVKAEHNRLNIALLDKTGLVCAKLFGLASRPLQVRTPAEATSVQITVPTSNLSFHKDTPLSVFK